MKINNFRGHLAEISDRKENHCPKESHWYQAERPNLENLLPVLRPRLSHVDATVETSRPEECKVEDVFTIRRADDEDLVIHREAVHLDEQLQQPLLSLRAARVTHTPSAPRFPDGVDLVDEHDRRRRFARVFEQASDARRRDSREHLRQRQYHRFNRNNA